MWGTSLNTRRVIVALWLSGPWPGPPAIQHQLWDTLAPSTIQPVIQPQPPSTAGWHHLWDTPDTAAICFRSWLNSGLQTEILKPDFVKKKGQTPALGPPGTLAPLTSKSTQTLQYPGHVASHIRKHPCKQANILESRPTLDPGPLNSQPSTPPKNY